jgi:hypothetical protein
VGGLIPVLAVVWWAPLAIIGGAAGGAVVGYLLLAVAGTGRSRPAGGGSGRLAFERAERSSDVRWNPWAFLVAGALVALVVGLSVGLSVS